MEEFQALDMSPRINDHISDISGIMNAYRTATNNEEDETGGEYSGISGETGGEVGGEGICGETGGETGGEYLNNYQGLMFEPFSIEENLSGLEIGVISAYDPDGDQLTFELSGSNAHHFNLSPYEGPSIALWGDGNTINLNES